jgi:hypothetical protein
MSEANDVSRALTFGLAGTLVVAGAALYFASQAPVGQRAQPRLIEVECLNVERGPTLRFENGLLKTSDAVVGTYRFLPASPGKYGPSIEVEGLALSNKRVRRSHAAAKTKTDTSLILAVHESFSPL